MNIRDVAELAGVSPATVSRYINKSVNVAPHTAEKIERVLQLTEYTTARSKKQKVDFNRNRTIGVMISDLSNPVYAEILSGIKDQAEHLGLSTLVMETKHKTDKEITTVIDFIRQRVNGMILSFSQKTNEEVINMLTSFKFPFCLLHTQSLDDDPCVFVNNYQAGWDVASQLYKLGHRNMAIAINREQLSGRSEERYRGFKDFLTKKKCPINVFDLSLSDDNVLSPMHLASLKSDTSPTVMFCANDLLAVRMIKELRVIGLSVPENISVVGFDGTEMGQLITHDLATVKVPNAEMGRVAVDVLENTKLGVKSPNQMAIDYQLSLSGTVVAIN